MFSKILIFHSTQTRSHFLICEATEGEFKRIMGNIRARSERCLPYYNVLSVSRITRSLFKHKAT